MLSSVAWIPRGIAKVSFPDDDDDVPPQNADMDVEMATDDNNNNDRNEQPNSSDSSDDEDGIVDVADVLKDDFEGLRFFKSNKEDPLLKAAGLDKEVIYDSDEIHDLTVNDTDRLIVVLRNDDDASFLEVQLYEQEDEDEDEEDGDGNKMDEHDRVKARRANLFPHHDILLPAFPLCVAWSDFDPRLVNTTAAASNHTQFLQHDLSPAPRGNVAAVGTFLPGIEIYDMNPVEAMEPIVILGGYDFSKPPIVPGSSNRGKKKKKSRNKMIHHPLPPDPSRPAAFPLFPDSHTDAILALSWNSLHRGYLASGSADHTVKCWDVEEQRCVQTLAHHKDKVQAVQWHPSQAGLLLTGSFDQSVTVLDARSPNDISVKIKTKSDVESAYWYNDTNASLFHLLIATENGHLALYDTRNVSCSLFDLKAHDGPVSSCALSSLVPGLIATGSTDKILKIWDVHNLVQEAAKAPKVSGQPVFQSNPNAGAIFGLAFCDDPDAPFLLAAAGSKGKLRVLDLAKESPSVRSTFASRTELTILQRAEKRASRAPQKAKVSESSDESDDSA